AVLLRWSRCCWVAVPGMHVATLARGERERHESSRRVAMDTRLVTILVIVFLVVLAVGWVFGEARRTAQLRGRFGPEYFRVIREHRGDRRRARAALLERERRVRAFRLNPLLDHDRDRFAAQWRGIETRFVDDPASSVTLADRLVAEVMSARGYPTV